MQRVLKLSALGTAVRLLPMAVMGIIVNVSHYHNFPQSIHSNIDQAIAALLLHRVSNKVLMAVGAFAYVISYILMAVQRTGDSYWALAFPAFCLNVVGAELQFNVTNVHFH